jgi:predicted DNA-binding transcriptional regulator AlpA
VIRFDPNAIYTETDLIAAYGLSFNDLERGRASGELAFKELARGKRVYFGAALLRWLSGGQLPDATSSASPDPAPASEVPGQIGELLVREQEDPLVTLDQMAALVKRSKRTLYRYANRPQVGMPPPEIEGGGGKASYWRWSAIRPWLNATFERDFPEVRPLRL